MEKELDRRLKLNVKKGKGVSNKFLDKFCRLGTSQHFRGVFSADDIPHRLCRQAHFIIIVNLASRRGPIAAKVGHFITIIVSPEGCLYIDPYGLRCEERQTLKFLHSCHRPIFENVTKVQHPNSVYCALFALLFTFYFDRFQPSPPFKLRFYKKNLKKNDKLCVQYLKEIVLSRARVMS